MSPPTVNNSRSISGRPDPVVLAVDTTGPRSGLAIARGSHLLAALVSSRVEPHSRTLFDQLILLLGQAGLELSGIDLFAVVTGPGSFTGLRVGISALKGLVAAADRPLFGVDRFDLTAQSVGCAGTVLILLQAGRGEIYGALRRISPDGRAVKIGTDLYGQPPAVVKHLLGHRLGQPRCLTEPSNDSSLYIVGDGVDESFTVLTQHSIEDSLPMVKVSVADPLGTGWQIVQSDSIDAIQLAFAVGRLSAHPENDSLPACLPLYIRPSDAELNWLHS